MKDASKQDRNRIRRMSVEEFDELTTCVQTKGKGCPNVACVDCPYLRMIEAKDNLQSGDLWDI